MIDQVFKAGLLSDRPHSHSCFARHWSSGLEFWDSADLGQILVFRPPGRRSEAVSRLVSLAVWSRWMWACERMPHTHGYAQRSKSVLELSALN